MSQIRVHNITDRPNVDAPAYAVKVGGYRIRPGKCEVVDESLLSPKLRKLHGSAIWIGSQVPAKYKATSRAALRKLNSSTPSMTIEQAREYLAAMSQEELLSMCEKMSPALTFPQAPSSRMLSVKLARAAFSERVLDPETFFWLRRWEKKGDVYLERD